MNSIKYCLDTNVINTHLFEIEPNHVLVTEFMNDYSNLYYTEHIGFEVDTVTNKKTRFISNFLYDCVNILDTSREEIIDYNSFISLVMSYDKTYVFKNQKVSSKIKRKILTLFWNNYNFYNVDIVHLRKSILEYARSIRSSTLLYKEKVLRQMSLIKQYENKDEIVIAKLRNNNVHKEDMYIILDICEFYVKKKIKLIFVSFDKSLIKSLKICNFDFILDVWDLPKLKDMI